MKIKYCYGIIGRHWVVTEGIIGKGMKMDHELWRVKVKLIKGRTSASSPNPGARLTHELKLMW